jgi:hypothetical protein
LNEKRRPAGPELFPKRRGVRLNPWGRFKHAAQALSKSPLLLSWKFLYTHMDGITLGYDRKAAGKLSWTPIEQ